MTDRPVPDVPPESSPSAPEWEALARALETDDPAALTAWAHAHPQHAAFADLVRDRLAAPEPALPSPEATERALASVRARMDAPRLTVTRGGAAAPVRRAPTPSVEAAPAWHRWRAPAAVAAALAAVWVGMVRPGATGTSAAAPAAYATTRGVTDTLALPDGSQVILGPDSRLQLADGYGGRHRTVRLEGAAFFTVTHDAARPFAVQVAGAEVRDIGTAFSVKTDREGGVAVAVTEGVVELRAAGADGVPRSGAPAVTLQAGDRGDVARDGRVAPGRGVVDSAMVAWTRGQLVYRDAPLREVQADLRRWYGVDVQVTDSLLARRTLTASLPADSAAQVLRVVALALGADLLTRGDTVVLLPQGIVPEGSVPPRAP
jgi:transmembrane sensor